MALPHLGCHLPHGRHLRGAVSDEQVSAKQSQGIIAGYCLVGARCPASLQGVCRGLCLVTTKCFRWADKLCCSRSCLQLLHGEDALPRRAQLQHDDLRLDRPYELPEKRRARSACQLVSVGGGIIVWLLRMAASQQAL